MCCGAHGQKEYRHLRNPLIGLTVFVLKLVAYFLSNSVALLSDALESTINIVASVMMFFALMLASRPEDEDDKYGHQKAENISALVEGVLIIIAAILIVQAAVGRLSDPVPLEDINLGLVLSLSATSLNGILAWAMMKEAKRSRSMALEGDAKHLFSDVVSSIGGGAGPHHRGIDRSLHSRFRDSYSRGGPADQDGGGRPPEDHP